jgi:hypothetical protein
MKEKTVKENAITITVVSIILFLSLSWLDQQRKFIVFDNTKREIRLEMNGLYESILIGMSREELLRVVSRFVDLRNGYISSYRHTNNEDILKVAAPVEFPGFTWFWNVYIFLEKDIVVGAAIRPIDGASYKIYDAPPDKGLIQSEFKPR